MDIKFTARKTEIFPGFKERAQKKLDKLDRFFDGDPRANLTLTLEKDRFTVEITLTVKGFFYRAEETSDEPITALDSTCDSLVRQIVKNKNKLQNRTRLTDIPFMATDFGLDEPDEESEFRILRSKRFPVKPMMVDEAILQMNLLNHDFFIFRNAVTDEINVVYARKDGNYGLIEPDDAIDED